MGIEKKSLAGRVTRPKTSETTEPGNPQTKPAKQAKSGEAKRLTVAKLATAKLSTAKLAALKKIY